ncbi:MAG: hypothetical protein JO215_09465 [Ktedonobacteraceae bacterium]|nr:hypothetical protein [Ktedonobacteraceae bacterium]
MDSKSDAAARAREGEGRTSVTVGSSNSAFEAVAGLIIEGIFVAMLTQRFLSK